MPLCSANIWTENVETGDIFPQRPIGTWKCADGILLLPNEHDPPGAASFTADLSSLSTVVRLSQRISIHRSLDYCLPFQDELVAIFRQEQFACGHVDDSQLYHHRCSSLR